MELDNLFISHYEYLLQQKMRILESVSIKALMRPKDYDRPRELKNEKYLFYMPQNRYFQAKIMP